MSNNYMPDDDLGKEALKAIIRDDISPYDGWYWAEVSGAIEHYFKKFNGNPIPNAFAAIFLERDPDDLKLESDGVHYTREIGVDHIPFTKMIYGFKSKELADEGMKSIQDYEEFKLEINKLEERLFGKKNSYDEEIRRLKIACMTISAVHDFEVEHDFNEMLPVWSDKLKRALRTIERSTAIDAELSRRAKACYKRGKILLETMPILTIKQFYVG